MKKYPWTPPATVNGRAAAGVDGGAAKCEAVVSIARWSHTQYNISNYCTWEGEGALECVNALLTKCNDYDYSKQLALIIITFSAQCMWMAKGSVMSMYSDFTMTSQTRNDDSKFLTKPSHSWLKRKQEKTTLLIRTYVVCSTGLSWWCRCNTHIAVETERWYNSRKVDYQPRVLNTIWQHADHNRAREDLNHRM